MKKKIVLAILYGLANYGLLSAQTDSLFYYLDKATLTNSVLAPFNDTTYWGLYDGIHEKESDNIFTMQILSDLNYYSFGPPNKPSADSIQIKAAREIRLNHIIPIVIINYEYTRLRANAIADSLVKLENGKYFDILPRNQTPYENAQLFVAAPLKEKIYNGNTTFILSRDYFISNLPDPQQIFMDFDDGVGYRQVNFGDSISINYADGNAKHFKIKFQNNSTASVAKSTSQTEWCRCSYTYPNCAYPAVDEFMTITATIPFFNPSYYPMQPQDGQWWDANATGKSYASVYVKYGNGHPNGNFVKPLIFVEGIYFGYESLYHDYNGNVIRNGDVGWCEFWGNSYDPNNTSNTLDGYPEFKNAPGLLNELLAEGYDIMFVDFIDGADFIQRNAMILVELSHDIATRQNIGGYEFQPAVMVGASMGGQVAKYALSYMEQNNIRHCTRLYGSFDSPQNGANIPLSLQEWIHFFAFNGLAGGDDDAKLQLRKKMNRPATRQLLVRHYEANYSQDRTDFQTTMNTIGYPNKLRKIAIACGSRFGTNQDNFANGQQILETEWSPSLCSFVKFIQGNCYSTGNGYLFNGRAFKTGALACFSLGLVGCPVCVSPGLIDKSTLLQSIYIPKWDNAPGGNRNSAKFIEQTYNDAVANYGGALGGSCSANPTGKPSQPLECFIPTISSLGINTSNLNYNADILLPKNSPNSIYPFEAYYASPINQPHVYLEDINAGVTNSNLAWSLQKILDSQPIVPWNLTLASPNGGQYNLCRFENRFITQCTIGNGAIYSVNYSAPAEFGAFTSPMPSTGVAAPVQGSTFEAYTCDCENAQVVIENGGQFYVGDNKTNNKAIVHFNSGSILKIKSGGKLIIADNSKLIIEEGAKLIFEAGAIIELNGDNALLEFKGKLHLGKDAIFTFTHPGHPESGYLLFDNPNWYDNNVTSVGNDCNSAFYLEGTSINDRVLEINQYALRDPDNCIFKFFTIKTGTVQLHGNTRLDIQGDIRLLNARVMSVDAVKGDGVFMYGQLNLFVGSKFLNLNEGINANLLSTNYLNVNTCQFTQCEIGVNNKGNFAHISNSIFEYTENNTAIGVNLTATTKPSYLLGNEFINLAQPVVAVVPAFAPVIMLNNIIHSSWLVPNTYEAIRIENGRLNMGCNTIENYVTGIHAKYMATLDMSGASNLGSNDVKNTVNAMVFKNAGYFYLFGGHNNFSPKLFPNGLVASGNLVGGVIAAPTIKCNVNQWTGNGTYSPINGTDYQLSILGLNNISWIVTLDDPTPAAWNGCQIVLPDPCDNPPCEAADRMSYTGAATISNMFYQNVEIDSAYNDAVSRIDSTSAGNLDAFNRLRLIVTTLLSNPNLNDKIVQNNSYYLMQTALADLVLLQEQGELNLNISIDECFTNLYTYIDNKIIEAISSQNYTSQLYFSLDKAHLKWLQGNRTEAINILNNMLSWVGVDEIDNIQYWQCVYSLQNDAILGNITFNDLNLAIAQCVPVGYNKLAAPQVSNSILSNSDYCKMHFDQQNNSMMFSMQSTIQDDQKFKLWNAYGQLISQYDVMVKSGQNELHFEVPKIAKGIYFFTGMINGKPHTQKFVVQ